LARPSPDWPGAELENMTSATLAQPLHRLAAAISVYLERQVLVVTLLGFAAGLPLALTTSTLMLWMTDVGVDLTTVGLYALAGLPYTLKFLWAPFVDAWRVPVLSGLLGRRRGWLIFTQLLLIAAIVLLGRLDPLAVAAADRPRRGIRRHGLGHPGHRDRCLPGREPGTDQQAAGVGGYVMAYRLALLISSAGVVGLVGFLEATGVATETVWFYGYAAAAGLIVLGMAAVLAGREPAVPESAAPESATAAPSAARPLVVAVKALGDMFTMPMAAAVLLFVLLFRFTDAFAGIMIGPFVIDIGYDKQAYAAIVKGLGTAAVIAGGLIGGVLAKALPLTTTLVDRRHSADDDQSRVLLDRAAGGRPHRPGARHRGRQRRQRHRDGDLHRLFVEPVRQPAAHGHPVCAPYRARLDRPHGAVGECRRGCRHVRLVLVLRGERAGRDSGSRAAGLVAGARPFRPDRARRRG
jgi:MFS transporter, PAT family, beta-lactamase induction signal transducer AmpG